jgi:hypothetical protein
MATLQRNRAKAITFIILAIHEPEFFNSRTDILPTGKYAGFAGEI